MRWLGGGRAQQTPDVVEGPRVLAQRAPHPGPPFIAPSVLEVSPPPSQP